MLEGSDPSSSMRALEAGTNVAANHAGGKQPVIGIAGTAGVAISTPKSTMLATGENLDIAVDGNLQQAVNRQWTLNAGGTLSWFAAGQTLPSPMLYTVTLRMPGIFTVHAAAYDFTSAATAAATLPAMPGSEQVRDWLGLHDLDPQTGEGIAGAPYEVRYGGGGTLAGTLDTQGKAKHPNVPHFKLKDVIYKPRPPKQDKEYDPREKLL